MREIGRGLLYDTVEMTWAELQPGLHVIGKGGALWRLEECRDGRWHAKRHLDDPGQIWPAQDPTRKVPVAILHPSDPVTMLKDRLGAVPFAYKRNEDDEWLCAPWPLDEKEGNIPRDIYRSHLKEFHGITPEGGIPWEEFARWHEEHHTEGIAHLVKHTHPRRGS